MEILLNIVSAVALAVALAVVAFCIIALLVNGRAICDVIDGIIRMPEATED